MRAPLGVRAVVLLIAVARADAALATTITMEPGIGSRVVGAAGILNPHGFWSVETVGGTHWLVEVVEELLYDIPGLRLDGGRSVVAFDGIGGTVRWARVNTAIGSETTIGVGAVRCSNDSWAVSLDADHSVVSLDGFEASRTTTVTTRTRLRLTPWATIGAQIARFRVTGDPDPGADVTLVGTVRPASGVVVLAAFGIDRRYGAEPGLAVSVRPFSAVRLTTGYETATSMLKAAVDIRHGGVGLTAGAFVHPVLGTRRAVSLSWQR
jgi:hypothetical protein